MTGRAKAAWISGLIVVLAGTVIVGLALFSSDELSFSRISNQARECTASYFGEWKGGTQVASCGDDCQHPMVEAYYNAEKDLIQVCPLGVSRFSRRVKNISGQECSYHDALFFVLVHEFVHAWDYKTVQFKVASPSWGGFEGLRDGMYFGIPVVLGALCRAEKKFDVLHSVKEGLALYLALRIVEIHRGTAFAAKFRKYVYGCGFEVYSSGLKFVAALAKLGWDPIRGREGLYKAPPALHAELKFPELYFNRERLQGEFFEKQYEELLSVTGFWKDERPSKEDFNGKVAELAVGREEIAKVFLCDPPRYLFFREWNRDKASVEDIFLTFPFPEEVVFRSGKYLCLSARQWLMVVVVIDLLEVLKEGRGTGNPKRPNGEEEGK